MNVSFATLEDLDGIKNLLDARKNDKSSSNRYFPYREIDDYRKLLTEPYLSYGEHRVVVGKVNGEIVIMLEMVLRGIYPSWHLFGLLIMPGKPFYNCSTNGFSDCLDFCFNYAESLGYYHYDYSYKAGKNYFNRWVRTLEQIPALKRYDHYILGYVPAYTKSKWLGINNMMGGLKPHDMVIRCGMLKQEFRKYSPLL